MASWLAGENPRTEAEMEIVRRYANVGPEANWATKMEISKIREKQYYGGVAIDKFESIDTESENLHDVVVSVFHRQRRSRKTM